MIKHNRLYFRFALITIALLAAGKLGAQTVLYNNLATSSSNPVATFLAPTKLGQSFTAGSSGAISSVTLNLTSGYNSSMVTYSVELWSDSGGSVPSSKLATFVSGQNWQNVYSGLFSIYNASNTITFSSANFTDQYSVASGTTYWLVVASSAASFEGWGVSSTSGGSTARYVGGVWSPFSTGSGALGAEILLAVPEPSTYAAVAGLVALGVAGLSRRSRAL